MIKLVCVRENYADESISYIAIFLLPFQNNYRNKSPSISLLFNQPVQTTKTNKQTNKQAITQRAIRKRIKIKRVSKGYPSPSRSRLVGTPCEL